MKRKTPAKERQRRYRAGKWAETLAAWSLRLKGYRILERRWTSPGGEIDIIAVRGRRLAFVEVKRRPTFEDAEASIGTLQSQRIGDAANYWLSRHPAYQAYDLGFDLIFVAARKWPRHIEHGL